MHCSLPLFLSLNKVCSVSNLEAIMQAGMCMHRHCLASILHGNVAQLAASAAVLVSSVPARQLACCMSIG